MKTDLVQSLTAYTCRICKKYNNDDLLIKRESNKDPLELEALLQEFFHYLNTCKIDRSTGRAVLLPVPVDRRIINDSIVRLYVQPDAGKALENFSVVEYSTNKTRKYKGENHSAVYSHNVVLYLNREMNVFVFHHYGQSGCKTVFLNVFNEFLSSKGLIAHLDVLMSNNMLSSGNRYIPEKISLITTYDDLSSDKADNTKKKRKKVEQETIITLNAPKAKNIKEWLKNVTTKEPTIDELKSILIKDNYPTEFEDAKLTLKFGKVRRSVNLNEFTGLMAEYDVTDKLKLYADGSVQLDSLFEVADEYACQFFE